LKPIVSRLVDDLLRLSTFELRDPAFLTRSLGPSLDEVSSALPAVEAPDGLYRRNLLYRDDSFELLYIDWGTGSATPIHDHAGQSCGVFVLEGTVAIDDYVLDESEIAAGIFPVALANVRETVRYGMTDFRAGEYALHRVRCSGSARTLHLYAAPIDSCGIYDPEKAERVPSKLAYDAQYRFP
jgi:cysteine dioxygenase